MEQFCCLLLSLLMIMLLPASAVSAADTEYAPAAASSDVIRVGWYELPGYMESRTDAVTGQTKYTGYNFAFWEDIARYAGWEYDFVQGDARSLYDQLRRGEIDMMAVMYSEERSNEVLFPAIASSSVYSVLFTRSDAALVSEGNMDGKTIGIERGSVYDKSLTDFAAQAGFSYEPRYFDSADAVRDAVESGAVDAGVMGGLWEDSRFQILARFAPMDGYYVIAPGREDLLHRLNEALEAILINSPNYIEKLQHRFLLSSDTLVFTETETAYLNSLTAPIRFGLIADRYPLCYLDKDSGKIDGILHNITQEIAAYANLPVEFVLLDTDTFDHLDELDVDFAAGAYRTEERLSDPSLVLTDPIYSSRLVAVVKKGENPEDSIHASCAILTSEQPVCPQMDLMFQMKAFGRYDDCLDAVMQGDCEITMISQYAADYYLQKPQYAALSVISSYEQSYDVCLMASSDVDPQLVSVLNKCIAAMTEDDLASVVIRNTTAKPYTLTVRDFVYAYRGMIAVVILFVVVVFTLLFANMRLNRRHIQTLTEANRHLAIAMEQAERANAARSEFTSRISHEIRTPLNIVLGNIAMAKNAGENMQKVHDCLEKSELSAKQLLRLLNAVLDQSSLESGGMKLANEPFDLQQLLAELGSVYSEQGQQKGICFALTVDPEVHTLLLGDMLRLHQILTNLLSNAMKFTSRGGKTALCVSQIAQQSDQVVLRFVVSDSGRGMNTAFLDRLFQPYEQENSTIAREFGGSGLGLSITKQLVTLMNGTIAVESEEGKGSVFTVELPFGKTEEAIHETSDTLPIPAAQGKILLVEDNALNSEITGELLGDAGYPYDLAENGALAVERFLAQPEAYCLILMDVQMPVMDGYQATEAIRAADVPRAKEIPIIAMTANASEEEARRALFAGMNDLLSKPVDIRLLYQALQKYGGMGQNDAE